MSFNLSAKEIFRKRQQFPKGHSSLANAYISSPVILSNIVYFASLLLLSYRILGALLCFLCTHPAACSRAGNRRQEFHSVPSRVRDRQLTFFFPTLVRKIQIQVCATACNLTKCTFFKTCFAPVALWLRWVWLGPEVWGRATNRFHPEVWWDTGFLSFSLCTIFVPWHCQMHTDAERGRKDAIPLFSFNETSPTAQGTGT